MMKNCENGYICRNQIRRAVAQGSYTTFTRWQHCAMGCGASIRVFAPFVMLLLRWRNSGCKGHSHVTASEKNYKGTIIEIKANKCCRYRKHTPACMEKQTWWTPRRHARNYSWLFQLVFCIQGSHSVSEMQFRITDYYPTSSGVTTTFLRNI